MILLLIFSFLAGLATVLSPCILPILPALLSAGTASGKKRPLGIVTGLVLSFTIFTLSLTAIVQSTGISANALRVAAVVLIALFSLFMIFPALSNWFSRIVSPLANLGQGAQKGAPKEGFASGFLFGAALGLVWTPCAGPILAAVTTLVATQAVTFEAILITLVYSIGAGVPMFLIAYGGNKAVTSSRMLSHHAERIRQGFGVLMLLSAFAIAFHWDMFLQQQVYSYFPPILIEDTPFVKSEIDKLHEKARTLQQTEQIRVVAGTFSDYGQAPELMGIVNWINSRPLSLMQLRGNVVLIDFWTYSCINCLRTLPYLKRWYRDYKDMGFVILGVHTPEFEFEKDSSNVIDATQRLGVDYPVAQDNDYKTWTAYSNRYWPAHYLIDQQGHLRLVHFGEGMYVETENAIRELLGLQPLEMKETAATSRPITHEIYLGTLRADSYVQGITLKLNQSADYSFAEPLEEDTVGLKGRWKAEEERLIAAGDNSFLKLDFQAKQVYLVLSGHSDSPVEVFLDGKPEKEFKVTEDRKYDIANTSYGRHAVLLKIPEGISAYAFTFGDE